MMVFLVRLLVFVVLLKIAYVSVAGALHGPVRWVTAALVCFILGMFACWKGPGRWGMSWFWVSTPTSLSGA